MIRFLFLLMAITAMIFLIAGLAKPWLLLWWEDVQTRRKVISVYGMVALSSYAVYWLLYFFV